ncbi:hypothetical protein Pmani_014945 [Petrolisthes manimaculis]|uniref:Uncharacterized protein n=1 Tax=Petrolisthes manimaculis TaxID=1843537 RepID=A0AAE1PSL0_9EUCA|nr:hypothetical protein Pmani_014945 [Petrolisthes manimaculis]
MEHQCSTNHELRTTAEDHILNKRFKYELSDEMKREKARKVKELRAAETEAQRKHRLKQNAARQAARRSKETPEQREARLIVGRKAARLRRLKKLNPNVNTDAVKIEEVTHTRTKRWGEGASTFLNPALDGVKVEEVTHTRNNKKWGEGGVVKEEVVGVGGGGGGEEESKAVDMSRYLSLTLKEENTNMAQQEAAQQPQQYTGGSHNLFRPMPEIMATSGQYVEKQSLATSGQYVEKQSMVTSGQYVQKQPMATSGQYVQKQPMATSGQYVERQSMATSGQYVQKQSAENPTGPQKGTNIMYR